MKPLEEYTVDSYHDLLDYAVVDQAGEDVGILYSMWSDQKTGAFEFLGVKSAWMIGKNHIVPAKGAQVDDENRKVQVPYPAEYLKGAPNFDAAAEVTEEQEQSIRAYYRSADSSTPVDPDKS